MAGRLNGKVAVITGGASGLGEATARLFSSEGAKIVIADRQTDKGEALVRALGNAAFARTDVTKEADVAAAVDLAVKQFGRLDCMINNAGIAGATGPIADTSAELFASTIAIMLTGVFYGMKHAARVMAAQRSGSILSTASVAGIAGGHGAHSYTAAKHGVVGLTRSVASELAPKGIRVNAIAPGSVPTALTANIRGDNIDNARAVSADMSPMKEIILPEEIAAGFLYLASDDGRHITGQVLAIDGGLTGFAPLSRGLHAGEANYFDAAGKTV
jgi:NAD(P)-dependent dehydrogenase (short-subunit alcohol dehydrogenase family)